MRTSSPVRIPVKAHVARNMKSVQEVLSQRVPILGASLGPDDTSASVRPETVGLGTPCSSDQLSNTENRERFSVPRSNCVGCDSVETGHGKAYRFPLAPSCLASLSCPLPDLDGWLLHSQQIQEVIQVQLTLKNIPERVSLVLCVVYPHPSKICTWGD